MIKGIGKRVVMLNNTESEMFEQAIFILKSQDKVRYEDVVKECERMMKLHTSENDRKSSNRLWKFGFFISLLFICILLMLLFYTLLI